MQMDFYLKRPAGRKSKTRFGISIKKTQNKKFCFGTEQKLKFVHQCN